MARIDVKIWGVQGKDPKYQKNKAAVTTFIDGSEDFVSIDAFKGEGRTYERREESEIVLFSDGKQVFSGRYKDLVRIVENQKAHDEASKGGVK